MKKKSIGERKAILSSEITKYLKQGFRVVSQTDTSAQLVKPKSFGCLIAFICFLLAFLPFFLYILYYWAKKDETIYLQINEFGELSRT